MAVIEFGAWLPDQPRYNNPCITARNVLPIATGYAPFPSPASISDALTSACLGVICFKRQNGNIETFAGTATQLWRLSGSSWEDVSKAGAYSTSTNWNFCLYGDRLVANNGIDNPQKFDLASDTDFSDLTNAPITRYMIVIRDVLVALDVQDGSGYQIKFSAVNDSTKWSADCGGGAQELPDGGKVVGGTGGEFGVIYQERALTRMNFVGGDLRFTFDRLEGSVGCVEPLSIVEYRGRSFSLSGEGFQVFTGAESQNISDNAVSQYFETNRISGHLSAALDPVNACVVWTYPITGDRRMLVYNYRVGRWSESTAVVTYLHTGITSDGDILRGFNSSHELVEFDGSAQSAVVSTGDLQLAKDRRAMVTSVRGLIDSAHDVLIARKDFLGDSESTTSGSSSARGKVSLRANAKFHRFQLTPTATWTEMVGVDVEVRPSGKR